jgi:hypothetical protein
MHQIAHGGLLRRIGRGLGFWWRDHLDGQALDQGAVPCRNDSKGRIFNRRARLKSVHIGQQSVGAVAEANAAWLCLLHDAAATLRVRPQMS